MLNNSFIETIKYPTFVINSRTGTICRYNKSFQIIFAEELLKERQSSSVSLRTVISKILIYMNDLDSISFTYDFQIRGERKLSKLICQYTDEFKTEINVIIDFSFERMMIPFGDYAITNFIPSAILVLENYQNQYYIRHANDDFYEMLGYSNKEYDQVVNQRLFTILDEKDSTQVYQKLRHNLFKDSQFYINGRIKCKNGVFRWVNLTGKIIKAIDNTEWIIALITDISESLQLRETLLQEIQSFAALEHISKDIVFRCDLIKDNITFSGHLLSHLIGVPFIQYDIKDILEGKTILKINIVQLKKMIRMIRRREKKNFVFYAHDSQKRKYWLSIDCDFIKDENNIDVSIVGIITDITEQVEAKSYYEKAIMLWTSKHDNSIAAIAININTGNLISGHSKLFPNLKNMDGKIYSKEFLKNVVDESVRKKIKKELSPKNILKLYHEGQRFFNYELQVNINRTLRWLQMSVEIHRNPKGEDLIALLKWEDINGLKMQQKINNLLFYKEYDFICCIFAKTDSYIFVSDIENSSVVPRSAIHTYEATAMSIIEQYANPADKEFLKSSFTIKNLISQLSINEKYSFTAHGKYPDGSPAVKVNSFSYLDKERELILYTRKDITNQAGMLSFKSQNSVCNIPYSDVIYIESFGKKSVIVTPQLEYEVNEMLSSIQKRLPGRDFIRCHRCYIIRYSAIRKIEKNIAIMINSAKISVSRNMLGQLKTQINAMTDGT